MAKIRYIGKKEKKLDTISGTGLIWLGNGDIQEVPASAVSKLIQHTDSFELVDSGSEVIEADEALESSTAVVVEAQEDDKPPMANLETMDAEALRQYAQRHFGHEFHHKTGEEKMRQTIVGLMNRG